MGWVVLRWAEIKKSREFKCWSKFFCVFWKNSNKFEKFISKTPKNFKFLLKPQNVLGWVGLRWGEMKKSYKFKCWSCTTTPRRTLIYTDGDIINIGSKLPRGAIF